VIWLFCVWCVTRECCHTPLSTMQVVMSQPSLFKQAVFTRRCINAVIAVLECISWAAMGVVFGIIARADNK